MNAIGVVGLGKLGVPLVASLAENGFEVKGLDVDQFTVRALETGTLATQEPGLAQVLKEHRERMSFTTDYSKLVAATQLAFIIVPTPSTLQHPDFMTQYVEDAIRAIVFQLILQRREDYTIVVVSTVMPGTCKKVLWPLIEELTQYNTQFRPHLVYSPEFIALGNVLHGMRHPDTLLIGAADAEVGRRVEKILLRLPRCNPPTRLMNWTNAEIAKLCINAGLSWKITLGNMVADVCDVLNDADCDVVAQAMGDDTRIGPKLLKGGMGFGGPCLPRDVRALASIGPNAGLLNAVSEYNESRVDLAIESIVNRVPKPGPIAVLGVAYRDGTPVVDESQPLQVAMALHAAGYHVRACDKAIAADCKIAWSLPKISWHDDVNVCVAGCHGVVMPKFTSQVQELAPQSLVTDCVVVDCWRQRPDFQNWANIQYVPLGRGPHG